MQDKKRFNFFVQVYDGSTEESMLYCQRARNSKQAVCFVLRDHFFDEELADGGTIGSECPMDGELDTILAWLAEFAELRIKSHSWGSVIPKRVKRTEGQNDVS